jgi:uncharacterized protein YjbI with pentapeptide repeats
MLPVPPRSPDTAPILNATPFHVFPMSWQLRPGEDATILVVKGTFDLVLQQPARPSKEQELPCGEVPFADAESPECLRYPGDTALFKPKADVFLIGRAYPLPDGLPAALVQFALGRALDVAVAVTGDRTWKQGVPTSPLPFEAGIELRADRAFGGPGFAANPIGRGYPQREGGALPNIEAREHVIRLPGDTPPPALTTPIPSTWKARSRFAGTYGEAWRKTRWPYFPDDFDWRYFNAASEAWQISYPQGDETYWIKGVTRDRGLLSGQLPGLRVRAFAQSALLPDQLTELPMNIDTVWFDVEHGKLVLVWRGAIPCVDPYATDVASFFVYAHPVGEPQDQSHARRIFLETFERLYGEAAEREEEAEATEETRPPPGVEPPRGLTARMARSLGLPPWAATVHDPDEAELSVPEPPPPAPALSRDEVEALVRSGGSLAEQDLSRCDLRDLDLSGRDLSAAILVGANLGNANFAGANLEGAILAEVRAPAVNFSNAKLDGADLSQAELTGADFSGACLDGATLEQAQASHASFERAVLRGAAAMGADFTRARFDGADLSDADLSDAVLAATSMRGVIAPDLRLYRVQASELVADDAELPRLRADEAVFVRASFQRVKAASSSIRQANLTEADFRKALLEESVFEDSNLERALFSQAEAKACRWPRARAQRASFLKANLMEGFFESAVFDEADLRGANLYRADTFRASFARANLTHAILGQSGLD